MTLNRPFDGVSGQAHDADQVVRNVERPSHSVPNRADKRGLGTGSAVAAGDLHEDANRRAVVGLGRCRVCHRHHDRRLGWPMTASPILVIGELCPDIVVAGVPTDGRTLRFGQSEDLVAGTVMTLGSSAGITACAVAAAATPVRLKAVRGDDEFGAACHRWLTERGVDAGPVRIDPTVRTGSSVILVRADDPGDREILTDLGAMTALTVADLDDELLTSAGHVHVSSFFLHTGASDDLHTRLRRARELGCTVSLDTNDDPDRLWGSGAREAIGEFDVLFVNESEARGLAGADASEPLAVVVMELLALMPRQGRDPRLPAVVLKLGAAGASVHTRTDSWQVAAQEVTVADTVGAGDTLAGTCLALLASGAAWPATLQHGVAAGTLSTRSPGGTAGQQPLAVVAQLAASLPLHHADVPQSEEKPR